MQDKENKDIKKLIVEELAKYLGVDIEDINEDDSFSSDLHMKASDLVDFMQILEIKGIDTSNIELTNIDTVADLVEILKEEML